MRFDEDDDEFIPFSAKQEMRGGGEKPKKKTRFNAWLGEVEELDDRDGGDELPAHLRPFVDDSSGFVKGGGLQEQLKKKKDDATTTSAPKKAKKAKKEAVAEAPKAKFGIGLALLQKIGWDGKGLGKNGTGITQALDVKVRPLGKGLGTIEEKTEAQKKLERQRRGEDEDDDDGDDDNDESAGVEEIPRMPGMRKRGSAAVVDRSQRWKKTTSAAVEKPKIKSAYDVLLEDDAVPAAQKMTIIDLTGPGARVVTDVKQLYDKERAATDYKAGIGRELRYNVDKLVDNAEVELKQKGRVEAQVRKRIETFGEQERELERTAEDVDARLLQLQEAEALVLRLIQAAPDMSAAAAASDAALESLVTKLEKAFRGAKTRFGSDLFAALQLPDLLFGLLEKSLSAYFAASSYLSDSPARGKKMAQALKGLLEGCSVPVLEDNIEPLDYWVLLQNVVIVPPLRSFLVREWDCKNQAHVAVDVLSEWKTVLDSEAFHFVLYDVVGPKLVAHVEAWDPSTDPVPLHEWLHPWLPELSSFMEQTMYPVIVRKLNVSLSKWDARDGSAHALLHPWRTCFSEAQRENVAQTRLLPVLSQLVSSSFKMGPGQQDTDDVLHAVLVWHDWVPSGSFVKLLARSVFPRIYRSAYEWVTSPVRPSGAQVIAWYKELKGSFPSALFGNAKVCILFAHLLDVVLNVLVGKVTDFEPELLLVDLWVDEKQALPQRVASSVSAPSAASDALSFRSMIEAFASERGILFFPLPAGKTHNGKPLYNFGGTTIYFANQLVYAEEQPGRWTMVSLEYLAQLSSVAPSKKAAKVDID